MALDPSVGLDTIEPAVEVALSPLRADIGAEDIAVFVPVGEFAFLLARGPQRFEAGVEVVCQRQDALARALRGCCRGSCAERLLVRPGDLRR